MMTRIAAGVVYPLMAGAFLPKKVRPIWQAAWVGATALAVINVVATLSPVSLRYVKTPSIPLGWYLAKDVNASTLKRGDLACFPYTPAEWAKGRDYAKDGMSFCKPIAGLSGDIIGIDNGIISITHKDTGIITTHGKIKAKDAKGRDIPEGLLATGPIPPGTFVLLSSYSPDSFDSRYLGPIPINKITHQIYPIYTR